MEKRENGEGRVRGGKEGRREGGREKRWRMGCVMIVNGKSMGGRE